MMFTSEKDRAIAYATMKTLERMLDADGDLSPGMKLDVSGSKMTVILPPGSIVEREAGSKGDGMVMKKAVQNLYGYALWALMIRRLRAFKQWNMIRVAILEAMKEVVSRNGKNLRDQIIKENPEIADEIMAIQNELQIPDRQEETPRVFRSPKIPATIIIESK
jgi:hypothetical protein